MQADNKRVEPQAFTAKGVIWDPIFIRTMRKSKHGER